MFCILDKWLYSFLMTSINILELLTVSFIYFYYVRQLIIDIHWKHSLVIGDYGEWWVRKTLMEFFEPLVYIYITLFWSNVNVIACILCFILQCIILFILHLYKIVKQSFSARLIDMVIQHSWIIQIMTFFYIIIFS